MRRGFFFLPSAAAFTPTSISGCTLWLDATDPAGNGTPPSNGTAISSWVDKSGNSNTFTQGTSAKQPVYTTGAVNSLAALAFTRASNQYVSLSSGSFMTSGAGFDFFFVLTPTAVAGSQFFYQDHNTSKSPVLAITSTGVDCIADTGTWANGTYATTFTANSTYIIEFNYNGSGSTTNGNFAYNVNNSSISRTANNSGFGGTTSTIGSDVVDSTDAFGGYISEIVFYNSLLSSGNRTQVYNYLNGRWA